MRALGAAIAYPYYRIERIKSWPWTYYVIVYFDSWVWSYEKSAWLQEWKLDGLDERMYFELMAILEVEKTAIANWIINNKKKKQMQSGGYQKIEEDD